LGIRCRRIGLGIDFGSFAKKDEPNATPLAVHLREVWDEASWPARDGPIVDVMHFERTEEAFPPCHPGTRRSALWVSGWRLEPKGGTEMTSSDPPLTTKRLAELLERLATAQTITDVNIAAGIALNEVLGIDD
jgi:hypothetical protein